ncbi:MAG: transposase [Dechloromonas sp.]|nr:transposase [Dechloromonas sp.]
MDDFEHDGLAHMRFPNKHRAKFHCTNPLEGLNGELKRLTDVVCLFTIEPAVCRLSGCSSSSRTTSLTCGVVT